MMVTGLAVAVLDQRVGLVDLGYEGAESADFLGVGVSQLFVRRHLA